MPKHVFVILNYNTLNETRNCIESIQRLQGGNENPIIVVDNHSVEDISSIETIYFNVYLIKNEINLGYAKGNNLGYQIAKHLYDAEFIIALNSDTIIKQDDFLQCIEEIFNRTSFHILGPDIITKQEMHQNPARNVCTEHNEVRKRIFIQIMRLLKTYIPFVGGIGMGSKMMQQDYIERELENVALHGACLIFSPLYIANHEHAFYPNTFLYGEEEFLFYNARFNGEKMLYSPLLKIIHLEDVSTDRVVVGNLKKRRFVLKNSIISLLELRRFLRRLE